MNRFLKHIVPALFLLLGFTATAQQVGNEWIDYSKTYYRLEVTKTGIHRLSFSRLDQEPGVDPNAINPASYRLYANGQQVPIHVSNDGIEFFGKGNDGSFDTQLYADPDHQPNEHYSLFSDTTVYFLTWNVAGQGSRYSNVGNDLSNLPPKENYCNITIRDSRVGTFRRGKPFQLGKDPQVKSIFDEGEGFTDGDINFQSKNYPFNTPYVSTTQPFANLKASYMGTSNTDHSIQIDFNGTQIDNLSFQNFKLFKKDYLLSGSQLNNGNNNITFTSSGSGNVDRIAVAYLELEYASEMNFNGRSKQLFTLPDNNNERYLEIDGFDDKGTNPILYDLTNNIRIEGTATVGGPHRFKLPNQVAGEREMYLTSQDAIDIEDIQILERRTFTNYDNPAQQGNYIIISDPRMFNDGNGNNRVAEYAAYRASANGGGYKVVIAEIDELYDQFAYGIRKHPLSIKNFVLSAKDSWLTPPEYVFLIGKGMQYNDTRCSDPQCQNNSVNRDIIPPYGEPGSISLLTARPGSAVPEVPIGRLSIPKEDVDGIRRYLNKVKDLEAEQANVGDPYQTTTEKLWMKEILHLGGGTFQGEQDQFKFFLNGYENKIEDIHYGGNVTSYFKTSSSPIQIAQSQTLSDRIDNGVSLITFFGHSSGNSFDISLDAPENYQNYKRYPCILSLSCFSGNLYNTTPGISEDFVLEEDRGAIAFLATINLSQSQALHNFADKFYENLSVTKYSTKTGIGDLIKATIYDMENANLFDDRSQMVASEMTLHGDPAVVLNIHAVPDYALEAPLVWFDPPNISAQQTEFSMFIVVSNLGKAINDTINLEVSRTLPNGSSISINKQIPATYYQDTIEVVFQNNANNSFGLNEFYIHVDSYDSIPNELSETNNILGINKTITSDDIFPIYPYEFSIVWEQGITLKASTADAFAPERTYTIEIDTTEKFNSPIKLATSVTQTGGVVRWKPNITFIDSTVYYWRVGLDTAKHGNQFGFHNTSFIYIDGSSPGWNQSHYFQYLKDDFNNVYVDSNDRQFKFVDDLKEVKVKTGIYDLFTQNGLQADQIEYYLNGVSKHRWVCGGPKGFNQGMVIAVFDSLTGNPWVASVFDRINDPAGNTYMVNSTYKSIHCMPRDFEAFPFPMGSNPEPLWMNRALNLLNSVPNGNYVLIYTVNGVALDKLSPQLRDAIEALGSTIAPNFSNVAFPAPPWSLFAKKGDPGFAKESMEADAGDIHEATYSFTANWYQGTITSPLIGPAYGWGSFHWRWHDDDPKAIDETAIDIIGVRNDGIENVLFDDVTDLDLFINTIDASTYPYLKLRYDSRDDTFRTPTQLDYWRVIYDKVPEAALNPYVRFDFNDTVLQTGEPLTMTVAVENVTEIPMDSLLIKYEVTEKSGLQRPFYIRYDSLRAFETMMASFELPTIEPDNNGNLQAYLRELNGLFIEVNPDDDQLEQFHFNNIGLINFKLEGDAENPLLDVTFDGVHIMDGDIVSAEPEILIKLKDENKYLALNDTTLVNVLLQYPDGSNRRINFSSNEMEFYPALSSELNKNNIAEIILRHVFPESGEYQLLVQAKDQSENVSGNSGNPADGIDYRIAFEVIKEARITNVLNYPNPFTTSTRFVFTLTGSQPPSYFKIQIMTISGKVVRELTSAELGDIRVGQNITEFAWDGTDQYGDPLANGLYLYRVVANIDGKPIEHMDNGTDKFFKKGFGKMYIAR